MKIELKPEELQALDILFKRAKVDIQTGLILGLFRIRIQKTLQKGNKNE